MRVILFRHAETAWTLTGQHTGTTDLELTDAGKAQASASRQLFERVLDGQSLDAIYSSPRRRALQTAELALAHLGTPRQNDWLAEFDYGAYEGLTPAEIQSRAPGWSIWRDGCPEGETVEEIGVRADHFIRLLLSERQGQTVCVVSHGHMIRVLAARLLGLPASQGRLFAIKTASVAEFTPKDGAFTLARWNLTV